MYEYIRGQLVEKNPQYVVVDVQGMGYKIHTPSTLFGKLPEPGNQVTLSLSWVVREMSQTFYGFENKIERDLFEMLLSLSGVGPRTALSMMSHFSPQSLEDTVRKGDAVALARVPGIGKKTAERILVELKGRWNLEISSSPTISSIEQDALQALINLGYSQTHAQTSVKQAMTTLPKQHDLATLISTALKTRV